MYVYVCLTASGVLSLGEGEEEGRLTEGVVMSLCVALLHDCPAPLSQPRPAVQPAGP